MKVKDKYLNFYYEIIAVEDEDAFRLSRKLEIGKDGFLSMIDWTTL